MRVGLIRHFPVDYGLPSGWMTTAELQVWRDNYDKSTVTPCPAEMGPYKWDRCFTSDSERAYVTAKAVYGGEIVKTPLLREVNLAFLNTGNLRLPYWGWRWMFRLAWLTSHPSQQAAREDLRKRVCLVADMLKDQNTLLVSHAGFMAFFRRELIKRGFAGPRFSLPENGRLFVFESPALPKS